MEANKHENMCKYSVVVFAAATDDRIFPFHKCVRKNLGNFNFLCCGFVHGKKKHAQAHCISRMCRQTHPDQFRWTVIRIRRRTSETVNFDAIFECKNFANANRSCRSQTKREFHFEYSSHAIWLRCKQTKWLTRDDDTVDEVNGKVLFGLSLRWHNKSVKLFWVSTEVNITSAKSKQRRLPHPSHSLNCRTSNRCDINTYRMPFTLFCASTSFVEHLIRSRSKDLVQEEWVCVAAAVLSLGIPKYIIWVISCTLRAPYIEKEFSL